MSTTIRDINGNRVKRTLRHFTANLANAGRFHFDSTGLFCCEYMAESDCKMYQAFIRPETAAEENAVRVARKIGTDREA